MAIVLTLMGFAIGCISMFFSMRELDRRFEKREKGAESTAKRIPEVGDTYLILEHLWRVRSRQAYSDKGEIKYLIYREIMLDATDPPYDGAKHMSSGPEFFDQFQFIGNPEKDAMDVKAMVAQIALNNGVSQEEVVAALDSVTGEIDMSALREESEIDISTMSTVIPERPSDEEVAKDFFDRYKTLTGHAETDEKNRRKTIIEKFDAEGDTPE